MADQFDDIMEKHFQEAGIVEEKTEEKVEDKAPVEEKKEETVAPEKDADGFNLDKSLDEQKAGEPAKEGEKPAADVKDKPSGAVDGKAEPGKEEKAKVAGDPNDLTLQDGTVVKAGAERRWYETARVEKTERVRALNELNTVKQRYDTLQSKYTAMEDAAKVVGAADPVEMQSALRLYTDLKRDPQGTMKQLLVDIKGLGYTIEGLGPSVDTAAILAALDQKLPTKVAETSVDDTQTIISETVQSFFKDYPDAIVHDAMIAAVIEANPTATLAEAYLELKNAALAQGFDWTKDLGPQIEARKAAAANKDQVAKAADAPAPINGHAAVGSEAVIHDNNPVVYAETTEDAIKAAMREAGLKI